MNNSKVFKKKMPKIPLSNFPQKFLKSPLEGARKISGYAPDTHCFKIKLIFQKASEYLKINKNPK